MVDVLADRGPVFDAMASKVFRDSAGQIGTFCTKCHAPIGTARGEGGSTVAKTRSDISREGVSCDYCHVATDHTGVIGNNNLVGGNGTTKYGSIKDPMESPEHRGEHSDFITSSEMCGSCHDVFMDSRLQVELTYTEFVDSPSAGDGVRCQDCHMGPTPGAHTEREWGPAAVVDGVPYPDRELSNHLIVGPDHALIDGFPYPDDLEASAAAQGDYLLQVEALLKRSIEIESVSAEATEEGVTLAVTLRSLTDGHRVPTGFTSERQLWLQVEATDAIGETVYRSGDLDDDSNLRDAHSHAVSAGEVEQDDALVNLQSRNLMWITHVGEDVETSDGIFAFQSSVIKRRSLEPRESRTFSYLLPHDAERIQVTLNFRSMPPYVLQALHLDALSERLQIFRLDTAQTGW